MTAPDAGDGPTWPPTVDELVDLNGQPAASDANLRRLMLDGAVALVERLPHVARVLAAGQVPDAGIRAGTLLLAARFVTRRHSLAGVASFGDMGPSYITRHDPDVARLLRLGMPAVG